MYPIRWPNTGDSPPSDRPIPPLGAPSPELGLHTLRNEAIRSFISGTVMPRRSPASFTLVGSCRSLPAKPSHSVPVVGAFARFWPVAAVLTPADTEKLTTGWAGKLPGLHVHLRAAEIARLLGGEGFRGGDPLQQAEAGKRSSGTTLRSGSGLGIRVPLSEVVV